MSTKESIIRHDIVGQVWSKVGADLFQLEGRQYFITVDHLENFCQVDDLKGNATSSNVIYKHKQQFAPYRIPYEVITDNCPQFVSRKFQSFTRVAISAQNNNP